MSAEPLLHTLSLWQQMRRVVKLATPLVIVQVSNQLMGVVDTALAGQVDRWTLASTSLGASIFFVVTVFGIGVAFGADPLVSQSLGAGEHHRARHALVQGLWVVGFLSMILAILMMFISEHLGPWFGIDPAVAEGARSYTLARMPSILPMLMAVALRVYLQAMRVTRPLLVAVLVANVVNATVGWLLLLGDEALLRIGLPAVGLPAFGVAGIAWASTVSTCVQFLIIARAVRRIAQHDIELSPKPDLHVMLRIWQVGWPAGGQILAEVGCFITVTWLMGRMSPEALAAHQIALSLSGLTFSVCMGLSAATSVLVGRAIGAGHSLEARHVGMVSILIGILFMFIPTTVMMFFPQKLAQVMTVDRMVIHDAAALLRIAAIFQVVDAVQVIAAGALRGAGQTHFALLSNIVAHWCLGLPAGIVFCYGFGLGAVGLWWGFTVGLTFAALILTGRFVYISRMSIERIAM